jgi:hypothetical protein
MSKPSEEKGEKTNLPASTTLPCLRYYLLLSQTIGLRFWTAGFEKRVPNPAKKGRENELLYFRGKAAVVFVLDLRREFQIQRRRGEMMNFYTFAGNPRLYLCWVAKRVETQRRRERE